MTSPGKGAIVQPDGGKALWFLGDLYVVKLATPAFSVTEMTIAPAPRGGAPLHIHNREDEVFYVLDGALTYQVGDEKVEVAGGSVLYVPRGVLHGFSNLRRRPARALVFICPAGFEKFFEEVGQPAGALTLPPPTVPAPPIERITAVAQRYGTEVKGPPPSR